MRSRVMMLTINGYVCVHDRVGVMLDVYSSVAWLITDYRHHVECECVHDQRAWAAAKETRARVRNMHATRRRSLLTHSLTQTSLGAVRWRATLAATLSYDCGHSGASATMTKTNALTLIHECRQVMFALIGRRDTASGPTRDLYDKREAHRHNSRGQS